MKNNADECKIVQITSFAILLLNPLFEIFIYLTLFLLTSFLVTHNLKTIMCMQIYTWCLQCDCILGGEYTWTTSCDEFTDNQLCLPTLFALPI